MASALCAASMACLMLVAAALIFAVGNQHQHLASHLALELIGRGQVNGVVEDGSARLIDGGTGPGCRPPTSEFTCRPSRPLRRSLRRIGVVLQQVRIGAEADQECEILAAHNLAEELGGGVFFDLDQVALAGADVDQQADGRAADRSRD